MTQPNLGERIEVITEYAWLIERGDSPVSKPIYFAGYSQRGVTALWTCDLNAAVRFVRKEDADKVSHGFLDSKNRVAEHGWMKDTSRDTDFTPLKLPAPNIAQMKGWKYQVDWMDQCNVCFYRAKSLLEAEAWADTHLQNQRHYIREIPHDQ